MMDASTALGGTLARDQRRLAAIVSADVVGYSLLMGRDDSATLAGLKAHRRELIDPTIAEYGGRIVKTTGDGLLLEFSSVVDAVRCAADVQRGMAERNADVPSEKRIELRIGINVGDIILDGEDIFGDGVNVAARLQELAQPGGIVVSNAVVSHARNKVAQGFVALGERLLKNIDEAVAIYNVCLDDAGPGTTASEQVLVRPAVAILPFRNMSGDPAQEYFADGITEDLITALSAWRWFPVIARNSTFAFKTRSADVTQIGKALGARYVVEGSVQRAGDRVRIGAQLIDASSAVHLWAQSYDRRLGDVFDLQDEITRAIVGAIEPQLTRAEQQRAMRKRPENLDSWDLSLQALALIRRGTPRALAAANDLLVRAVAMSPSSSYAQSLLALTRFQVALVGWTSDPASTLDSTYDAAETAVALDDCDWLAHALLGIATLWKMRDYAKATIEEETAIALNPSAAIAYHFFGCVLTFDSRPAEAIRRLRAVPQLDPRFPFLAVTLADIGLAHLLIGEFEQAVRLCEQSIAERREHVRAWQRLASALGHLGRVKEAEAALAKVFELQPDFGPAYVDATYPFRDPAHTATFTEGLRKAGWSG
jgi:adenylate cyclase